MSEDNMSRLEKVRNMLPDAKKFVVALAIFGFMNSTPAQAQSFNRKQAKTEQVKGNYPEFTGTWLETDKTNEVYLKVNGEVVKVVSMKLAQAIKDVRNQRGSVGNITVYYNPNTSELMGAKVGHIWLDTMNGISKIRYEGEDLRDNAQELWNNIKEGNLTRIVNNAADMYQSTAPGYASAEQGSCVYVKGHRIVNGKDKEGWMPMHKRGADGYYMENGGNTSYTNQSRGNYQSSYTNQSGGGSYSQSTRSVSVNQLVKASENRGNGSGYTQNNTSNTGQVFVSNRTRGRFD